MLPTTKILGAFNLLGILMVVSLSSLNSCEKGETGDSETSIREINFWQRYAPKSPFNTVYVEISGIEGASDISFFREIKEKSSGIL